MFEREIRFIYDFNLNKVKQLGANFTFQALAAAPLHPAIIQYISAEIDYLIYEDRRHLLRNSSFDYSGEEINKYFLLINEEIKKQKKLSLDYIDQLILQAASFTVNFLSRPRWSLSKLIFEKEDTIEVAEAKQIINYIYYYEYIKNVSEKYFRKKNLETISRDEFEHLLENIDREVFDKYSEKLLDKVLVSMSDFFNTGSIHKTKIPLPALEMFLSEKKLEDFIQRISVACYPDPKSTYDITEIRKILFSAIPVKKDRYLDRVIKQDIPDSVFKSDPEQKEKIEVEDSQQIQTKIEASMEPGAAEVENDSGSDIMEDKPVIEPIVTKDTQAELIEETDKVNDSEMPIEIADEVRPEFTSAEEEKDLTIFNSAGEDETVILEIPEIIQKSDENEQLHPVFSEEETPELAAGSTTNVSPDDENETDNDIIIIDNSEEPEPVPDSPSETETSQTVKFENKFSFDESGAEEISEISNEEKNEKPEIAEDKTEETFIEEPVIPWSIEKEKKDILSFMSGKEINHIITNIFNEDTQDCALTFERISESKNLDEAFSIYDRVLKSYRVNPKLKEAVLLKKIIIEYFNQ